MRALARADLDVASFIDEQLGLPALGGLAVPAEGEGDELYAVDAEAAAFFASVHEKLTTTRHDIIDGRAPLTAGWSDAKGTDEVREHHEMQGEEAVLASFRDFLVDHGARMHEALADLGRLEKSFNDTSSVALSIAEQIVSAKDQAIRARHMEELLNMYNDIIESVVGAGMDHMQVLLDLEERLHDDMVSGRTRRGALNERLAELVHRATLLFELADATSTLRITPGPDLRRLERREVATGGAAADGERERESDGESAKDGAPATAEKAAAAAAAAEVTYTLESKTHIALAKIASVRTVLQTRLVDMFVHGAGRGKPMVDEMATIAPLLLLEQSGRREMQRRLIECITTTLCNVELADDDAAWLDNVLRTWEGQLRMIIHVFVIAPSARSAALHLGADLGARRGAGFASKDAPLAVDPERLRTASSICEGLVSSLFCDPARGVLSLVEAKLSSTADMIDIDIERADTIRCEARGRESVLAGEEEEASGGRDRSAPVPALAPGRGGGDIVRGEESKPYRDARAAKRAQYLNTLALTHCSMRELARQVSFLLCTVTLYATCSQCDSLPLTYLTCAAAHVDRRRGRAAPAALRYGRR
jgi:hypothetical protein